MNHEVINEALSPADFECCLCYQEGLESNLQDLDGEWFCDRHGKIKALPNNFLYVIRKSNRRVDDMDEFIIEEAALVQGKAKIAFVGPTGAGKTWTALITAHELGEKIIVIDTENRTSTKYAKNLPFPYQLIALSPPYSIDKYIKALQFASIKADVVIVDSLSHAWQGEGGALEEVEQTAKQLQGNKFAGWGPVTQKQNRLISTILNYPVHIIATMRMKMEYAQMEDDKGKKKIQKLGMGIVQRDSFEYEFDIIAEMDVNHFLRVTKTRCYELDDFHQDKPDGTLGRTVKEWLSTGEAVKYYNSTDDLTLQLMGEFDLDRDQAQSRMREVGLTSIPRDPAELHKRLGNVYVLVKNLMATEEVEAFE